MIGAEMLFVGVVAALAAALTPSAIGILIQLCARILGAGKSLSRMFWLGIIFTAALYICSLSLGVALLYLVSIVPILPANYLAVGVGIIVVNAGLIEMKDYFWYGRGLGLRVHTSAAQRIKRIIKRRATPAQALLLGSYASIAILPSVGAAYLAIIMLLRNNFDRSGISLLILYNGIFILPLILTLIMVAYGVRLSTMQRWKDDGKGRMRLGVGLMLVTLGWILLLMTNGALNLG